MRIASRVTVPFASITSPRFDTPTRSSCSPVWCSLAWLEEDDDARRPSRQFRRGICSGRPISTSASPRSARWSRISRVPSGSTPSASRPWPWLAAGADHRHRHGPRAVGRRGDRSGGISAGGHRSESEPAPALCSASRSRDWPGTQPTGSGWWSATPVTPSRAVAPRAGVEGLARFRRTRPPERNTR